MNYTSIYCFIIISIFSITTIWSQNNAQSTDTNTTQLSVDNFITQSDSNETQQNNTFEPLPTSFTTIQLYDSYEAVQTKLSQNSNFEYTIPDVEFSPEYMQSSLIASGKNYINSGIFQFINDTLFTITIIMNTEYIDFFSIVKTMQDKYGNASSMNPKQVIWRNENTQITLERPVTIHYMALDILRTQLQKNQDNENNATINREKFLEQL